MTSKVVTHQATEQISITEYWLYSKYSDGTINRVYVYQAQNYDGSFSELTGRTEDIAVEPPGLNWIKTGK